MARPGFRLTIFAKFFGLTLPPLACLSGAAGDGMTAASVRAFAMADCTACVRSVLAFLAAALSCAAADPGAANVSPPGRVGDNFLSN